MQIWEPCMPVLGSTPLLLRLPDLIVLPSTIFHRFLSLSLPPLFLESFLSSTLYSAVKTSKTSSNELVDLMEKSSWRLDLDDSFYMSYRVELYYIPLFFVPLSQIRTDEAECKTRYKTRRALALIQPGIINQKILLTDNYLTVWPANDLRQFRAVSLSQQPHPPRLLYTASKPRVCIFQSAYSIYATGFE